MRVKNISVKKCVLKMCVKNNSVKKRVKKY